MRVRRDVSTCNIPDNVSTNRCRKRRRRRRRSGFIMPRRPADSTTHIACRPTTIHDFIKKQPNPAISNNASPSHAISAPREGSPVLVSMQNRISSMHLSTTIRRIYEKDRRLIQLCCADSQSSLKLRKN